MLGPTWIVGVLEKDAVLATLETSVKVDDLTGESELIIKQRPREK